MTNTKIQTNEIRAKWSKLKEADLTNVRNHDELSALVEKSYNLGALRITPSWRRFAGLDRRARLAHERDGPFEGAFSFAQSLILPRFSTS